MPDNKTNCSFCRFVSYKMASHMKRAALFCLVMIGVFAPSSNAQDSAAAALVQEFVNAYNKQDLAYFEKMLTSDVVVPDDDGHILVDRPHMIDLFRRRFAVAPPDKLTASNVVTRAS